MQHIRFTCTTLRPRKNSLLKDADGYYEVILGALNVYNSSGAYYPYDKAAEELFKSSSVFMRRVTRGCLLGECGHPVRQEYPSFEAYYERVLSIDLRNVSHHIKEVWLKPSNDENVILIKGKVKPTGVKGEALKASLENKAENVAFSIRALTDDSIHNGVTYKSLYAIITWDHVVEPGIACADKYTELSLEERVDCLIDRQTLTSIHKRQSNQANISTEHNSPLLTVDELMISLGWKETPIKKSKLSEWK